MIEPPQVVQTESQPSAVIHLTVPRGEIQQVMGPGINELMAAVAAQGIATTGPWYSHHLRTDPDVFDFELGVPVASPVSPAGRVQPGRIPAATVVRTVYHGAYEGLGDAWGEFDAWLATAGHALAPDLWEQYLVGPESGPDPTAWRTALSRPLAS